MEAVGSKQVVLSSPHSALSCLHAGSSVGRDVVRGLQRGSVLGCMQKGQEWVAGGRAEPMEELMIPFHVPPPPAEEFL